MNVSNELEISGDIKLKGELKQFEIIKDCVE